MLNNEKPNEAYFIERKEASHERGRTHGRTDQRLYRKKYEGSTRGEMVVQKTRYSKNLISVRHQKKPPDKRRKNYGVSR